MSLPNVLSGIFDNKVKSYKIGLIIAIIDNLDYVLGKSKIDEVAKSFLIHYQVRESKGLPVEVPPLHMSAKWNQMKISQVRSLINTPLKALSHILEKNRNFIVIKKKVWLSINKEDLEQLHILAVNEFNMFLEGGAVRTKSVGRNILDTSDPIIEEQQNLNNNLKKIETIINELRSEKPIADFKLDQKKKEKFAQIEKATRNPYFGRIDIVENQLSETYYIGEVGIADSNMRLIVVDWRADIAKVFYSFHGGSSKVPYTVNNEQHVVIVNKKRHIQIENRKIINVVETNGRLIDDTANKPIIKDISSVRGTSDKIPRDNNSDPLAGILSAKNENHEFKDIIATIQMEQDEIIRLPMDKTIIVQGVAGSGKSSVALHRISYLLYKHRETLKAEKILILGPNLMFLTYINSVIPKLDIRGVQQNTFLKWALEQLSFLNLKIKDPYNKFSKILEKELIFEDIQFISKFKGSMKFKDVIDKFISSFVDNIQPKGNFYVNEDNFIEFKTIDDYFKSKKYLPINRRLEDLRQYLNRWCRDNEIKAIEIVRSQFNLIHDKWIEMLPQGSEERKEVYLLFEKLKEDKISKIKSQFKSTTDQYMKKIFLLNPKHIYEQLFQKEVLSSMDLGIEGDLIHHLFNSITKEMDYEDLGPLLYINSILNGWKETLEYVVVDEAQDHSPFELWLLNSVCKSALFLGDITQNIYTYRGIDDWKTLIPSVFLNEKTHYMDMDTSYRSTYQIMSVANEIIVNSKLDLPVIKPVMRHGELPKIEKVLHGKDLSENIKNSITTFREKGYKIISIICKDLYQSKNLFDYLKNSGVDSVQLIDNPNEELKEQIIVIPSYLSKGLEFDAVIIPNASKERYIVDNITDMKLLYVSVTRAQHDLHVYYHGELTPLLGNKTNTDQDALNNIL